MRPRRTELLTAMSRRRDGSDPLREYLCALARCASPSCLFEIRARYGQSMRRRFFPVRAHELVSAAIVSLARVRDVFVGAAPRSFPNGGREAITAVSTLWVDADTPEAILELERFAPAPSILIGSGRGRHAYWLLARSVAPEVGEDANRRLASFLGGDIQCADSARILRPPGTLNYGYRPARHVELLRFEYRTLALDTVIAGLPDLPAPASRDARRHHAGDPLLALDPAFYVEQLLGEKVGRDRKISCPFHRDAHPSLHVYATAERGWHCFSCSRGGSVYDLAASLWEVEARGRDFLRLRQRLHERLLGGAT